MIYDIDVLDAALRAAGIAISGCNELGVVWGEDGTTEIQGQKAVKAVLNSLEQFEKVPDVSK